VSSVIFCVSMIEQFCISHGAEIGLLSQGFLGCVIRRHSACTRAWSAREKFLKILRHGWELNPGYGEDRQWDTFILPLSYHDPGHGEDRQWDTFILSLTYYDQCRGEDRQWDTFILPLSYQDWLVWSVLRLLKWDYRRSNSVLWTCSSTIQVQLWYQYNYTLDTFVERIEPQTRAGQKPLIIVVNPPLSAIDFN